MEHSFRYIYLNPGHIITVTNPGVQQMSMNSSDLQHGPLYHVYEHTVSGQCYLNLIILDNTCIIIIICMNEL